MKKYFPFFIGAVFLLGLAAVLIGYHTEGAGLMYSSTVMAPFGAADLQTPVFAATLAVSVTNQVTILEPAQMTGAMTINLTIDPGVRTGAKLYLKASSDTTARDITFGTGFSAPVLAGVISKTKTIAFFYDGTAFLPCGAGLQIN